jgi:adenosylcobinamide-GDP ribazoletransferase
LAAAELMWCLTMFSPVPAGVASLLLLTLSIIFMGGLHLDGWMDCSDAYFSYRDVERRLAIMKDPHIGSFAVMSLLFLLAWRYVFMFEVVSSLKPADVIFMAGIPFLARIVMGSLLIFGRLAKTDGLAAYFKKDLHKRDFGVYAAFLLLWMGSGFVISGFSGTIALVISIFLFGAAASIFIKKQFGGLTGDTLGASVEGGETFLWLILWLLHAFVTV